MPVRSAAMTTGRRMRARVAACSLLAGVFATAAHAWGPQGHRLVALVAAEHLTPVARRNVAWLLDGASLADVAVWADEERERNSQTAAWHYVNLPEDATAYERERDCPRQPGVPAGAGADRWRDCVVDRILDHAERLADRSLDRADRARSLKFLVHLVADLHQPFHAFGRARGGNEILVEVFGSPTCSYDDGSRYPCNLHAVWDTELVVRRRLSDAAYHAELERIIRERGLERAAGGTPAEWALESLALARAALLPPGGAVDERYVGTHAATLDERLALAGLRLAALLEGALAAEPPG